MSLHRGIGWIEGTNWVGNILIAKCELQSGKYIAAWEGPDL